jgi:drug/metabolite transporter (DMT)-like permease
VLVCLAGLLFVGMNAVTKILTPRFDLGMLIWARYFFHVALVAFLFPRRLPGLLHTDQIGVQLLRSVVVLVATVLNFAALAWLSQGEVAAITFTTPILVVALSGPLLGETVGWRRWAAVLLGFAGALLIVRPGHVTFNSGALLALGCALAYALYQISTRIVRETEPMGSLLYGGLVGMVVSSLLLPWHWLTPTPAEWAALAAIGILGAVAHLMMILALRRAQASRVSPFTYLQLVWAMLSTLVLFGTVPPWSTFAGAAVVAVSGLLLYRLGAREAASR